MIVSLVQQAPATSVGPPGWLPGKPAPTLILHLECYGGPSRFCTISMEPARPLRHHQSLLIQGLGGWEIRQPIRDNGPTTVSNRALTSPSAEAGTVFLAQQQACSPAKEVTEGQAVPPARPQPSWLAVPPA